MYGPYKYYSSILGYKTSSAIRNDYNLADYIPGQFDYSHYSSGYSIPYFRFAVKLTSRTNGPLSKSRYNGIWQPVDLSFMAGTITKTDQIAKYLNDNLKFTEATVDRELRLTIASQRCTDNPDEEATVDFLIVSGDTRQFDAQRTDYSKSSIISASTFPVVRVNDKTTNPDNIINSGLGLSPSILTGSNCPSIYPTDQTQTAGTIGYITCCDGYTPGTKHQRGKWDLTNQINPVLFIRLFNTNTTIKSGSSILKPIYVGLLVVKLSKMLYTSQQIADTINMALSEISPCNQNNGFAATCSTANGTLPFRAAVSADGRIIICDSFYELAISGSYSYLEEIFSFDLTRTNETCSLRSGYVLKNVPAGCSNNAVAGTKTPAQIIKSIQDDDARLINLDYKTFDYTPAPIIEKISDYTSRGLSYVYAPTMTGPLSENIYALSNQSTSLSSKLWVQSQYIPNSKFSEFWSTFELEEGGILKAIGKDVNVIKVLSISASIKASWNYFEYPAGAYISYPFYNWALVLNSSTYCKIKPMPGTDTIFFGPDGALCTDFAASVNAKVKPSWDGNTENLQFIRARNKSCNTDLTQIGTVEIPRVYGRYRMGVAFDWKLWSRYNPNGVDSVDFSGAFAIPSITFKIAYY